MGSAHRKRILVICPYPEGVAPSQRLKYEQYFHYLRSQGYMITVSSFMTRRMWRIVYQPGRIAEKALWTLVGYVRRVGDVLRLPFYDGAYVVLWVTPFGPPLFEAIVARVSRRMVYDIDDMIFLGHGSRANRFIARFKGRSKMLYLMRKANHVIVCTPKLDEVVRRYNPHTTDISSTVDTEMYMPLVVHARKRSVTIGWSGSHSTSRYLRLLEPVLADVVRETGACVLVIGDPDFRFEHLDCETIPWNAATEVHDLRRIDIGVYPLPDEEWVYGKSGLKALQYMALGIPPVATAIGANFRVIEDGVSGFLVSTPQEWKTQLTRLALDPDLRGRIGARARTRVEELYSVSANRDKYLEVLRRAID